MQDNGEHRQREQGDAQTTLTPNTGRAATPLPASGGGGGAAQGRYQGGGSRPYRSACLSWGWRRNRPGQGPMGWPTALRA